MQRLTEEARYDEASRERILHLARELQRREQEGETLSDLERLGQAAGIDPRYVRMAAGQLPAASVTEVAPDRPWYRGNEAALASIALFVVAQAFSIARVIELGNVFLPISCAFALLMGLAFSRTRSFRWGAVAAVAGSTIASSFFYHFFYARYSMYTPVYRWTDAVLNVFILDMIALAVGFALASLGRAALHKFTSLAPIAGHPRS